MELEKLPLDEDRLYKRIFGGVAMPSAEAAGFAVVFGETKELGFEGKPKFIFLDEAEVWDGRDLIERCGWFDYRYTPNKWLGDRRSVALDKFVRELNRELTIEDVKAGRRDLKVTLSALLLGREADKPFSFIVPDLNRLLGGAGRDREKQRLFIKDNSKLMTYLKAPDIGDAVGMTFESHPAIAALAFCVLDLDKPVKRGPRQSHAKSNYGKIEK